MPGWRGVWARLEFPEPLLTKQKVKKAGYWPSSPFRFYWPRRGQYTAIWSNKLGLINKGFQLYGQKDKILLRTNGNNPEPA